MKPKNDENSVVALIKALILIVFLTIFFVFIAWVMSDKVEARPLPEDQKTTQEAASKKLCKTGLRGLAISVNKKSAIGRNANPADQLSVNV